MTDDLQHGYHPVALDLKVAYLWSSGILSEGPAGLRRKPSEYALRRYGPTYRWRLWLFFDIGELEAMERMINSGSDEDVFAFRRLHLASGATTTVVGSLLASVCATMLSLDSLSEVNLTVRGLFTVSLMLALLAVYFALIQQRALALSMDADSLRIWLWNGRKYGILNPVDGTEVSIRESSLSANMVLEAPFELLSISITLFLGALAAYLGLAMIQEVNLGTGSWP
ncbi:hypothetical protein DOTSEDRAFT_27473 [Dothistroma septosporum NZE10]|uniref:Uncharacterized protein n=1 Tax=Dothistroma septosporum (strain NZE10 / CBS 128990) TaxID=675120 RepID=N1PHS6_DOTSN|nr:hypothetical protein DOTSEDRAFT_27473 [Dothistroma septosporum NZE10]